MLTPLVQLLTALDQTLAQWVGVYGAWALAAVALIVFAETGLVVTPFLPGDSLLFVTGMVGATAGIDPVLTVVVLWAAAVAGDAVNFEVGRHAAPKVLSWLQGRWLRPQHLQATEDYFARYGRATIVIARFVPVVRTLAPFLAGAAHMRYRAFAAFNVAGGGLWVGTLVLAGRLLGDRPWVRTHLSQVTLAIVALSLLPLVHAMWKARRVRRQAAADPAT